MPVQGQKAASQPILLYALVEIEIHGKLETVSACELAEYPLFFYEKYGRR